MEAQIDAGPIRLRLPLIIKSPAGLICDLGRPRVRPFLNALVNGDRGWRSRIIAYLNPRIAHVDKVRAPDAGVFIDRLAIGDVPRVGAKGRKQTARPEANCDKK